MLEEGKGSFGDDMKHSHPRLKSGATEYLEGMNTTNGRLTFKYSTKRFKKATKCSAFLILPGIASFKRSSGSTVKEISSLSLRSYSLTLTWVSHECIFVYGIVGGILQTGDKLGVLVLQFCCISLFDSGRDMRLV